MTMVANTETTPQDELDPLAPHDEPTAGIVTITPQMARELLRRNHKNRNIYEPTVDDYSRDIKKNRFLINGEAIKLAVNGDILDGQHRLLAVKKADVPLRTFVVVGLPPETQDTMDSGRKRTVGDTLTLRGEANAYTLAAVLRRAWLWERGDYKLVGRTAPTKAECADLLEAHPEIRRSAEIAQRVRGTFRHIPTSVLGLCHYLFNAIDSDEAAWFFQRLADGAELPANHPVLVLRNRVSSERLEDVRIAEARHVEYLIRAWNAVREGRSLARLQRGRGDMPMPK